MEKCSHFDRLETSAERVGGEIVFFALLFLTSDVVAAQYYIFSSLISYREMFAYWSSDGV